MSSYSQHRAPAPHKYGPHDHSSAYATPPTSLRQARSGGSSSSRPRAAYDHLSAPSAPERRYASPTAPNDNQHARAGGFLDPRMGPANSLRRGSAEWVLKPHRSPSPAPCSHSHGPPSRPRTPAVEVEVNPVLERMKANGWGGIESGGTSGDSERHDSFDSGYGEEESGNVGGWGHKLKVAVWGGEDEPRSGAATPLPAPPKSTAGSGMWDTLTTKLQVLAVHSPWGEEDDDAVGEDGETKLGRAIREHHFSRAMSVNDIPEWLYTPAELAARSKQRSRDTRRPSATNASRSAPAVPQQQQRQADYTGSHRPRRRSAGSGAAIATYGAPQGVPNNQGGGGGGYVSSLKSRFDQRALPISTQVEDRPTVKAFQAEVEAAQAQARRRAAAQARAQAAAAAAAAAEANELADQVEELAVADEDEDERTLLDRLSSDAVDAGILSLLARQLDLNRGELILQLASHNLNSHSTVSLFDAPDPTHVVPDEFILPPGTVAVLHRAISSAASELGAVATVLHNPFDEAGKLKTSEGLASEGQTETESAKNDDLTRVRWTGRTVRLLVRKIPQGATELHETRVAVVGNVDAGKSSLLGVLTKGRLDDGRGRARVSLFRHKHEIESGRTSSVGMELLGFTPRGAEILPEGHNPLVEKSANIQHDPLAVQGMSSRAQKLSWEEIAAKASRIVTFSDLAGHERYLKTTLFGLTSSAPDFVLLIIGANAGLIGMSKEHLSVTLALSVPVVCVVTKVDSTPPLILEQTLKQLSKVLRSPGCRKAPVYVKDTGMALELASGFVAAKACPIFLVSNVSGEGLPALKSFLNAVDSTSASRYPVDGEFEFSISDIFSVPYAGTVVSGVILAGQVSVGDTVQLGPDSIGGFVSTQIKSIQRKRVAVGHAEAGQSVSFALKRVKRAGLRKGMVLLAPTAEPRAIQHFEGTTLILYHNTLITPRFQAMMHIGSVRQTVQIEAITDKSCIRTGDRAVVRFGFIKNAEHIREGDRFLLREGRTKALGIVTKCL